MAARRQRQSKHGAADLGASDAEAARRSGGGSETDLDDRSSQVAMLHASGSGEALFPSRPPPTALERLIASVSGAVSLRPLAARHEIASSTALQQLICANILLSAIWAIAWVMLFIWKASVWGPPVQVLIISPTLYLAWIIFEPMRLALGYFGNLNEQIGLLGPFLFSSLLQVHLAHLTHRRVLPQAGSCRLARRGRALGKFSPASNGHNAQGANLNLIFLRADARPALLCNGAELPRLGHT